MNTESLASLIAILILLPFTVYELIEWRMTTDDIERSNAYKTIGKAILGVTFFILLMWIDTHGRHNY